MFLIGDKPITSPIFSITASISIIVGVAGIGYLTNDLGDKRKDELISKPNASANLSLFSVVFLFLLFLLFALLPWFYLPFNSVSFAVLSFQFLLFCAYSFPPFRFKERGFLGVLTDTLYAHANPALLASYTFYRFNNISFETFLCFTVPLCAWQFVLGIRNIIFHQLKDYSNDFASGTKTFVIDFGEARSAAFCSKFLLPLEVILFLLFTIEITSYSVIFLPLVFLYWLITYIIHRKKTSDFTYRDFGYHFLDYLYIKWVPLIVLFALCLKSVDFWSIAVLHVIIFKTDVKTYLLNKLKINL